VGLSHHLARRLTNSYPPSDTHTDNARIPPNAGKRAGNARWTSVRHIPRMNCRTAEPTLCDAFLSDLLYAAIVYIVVTSTQPAGAMQLDSRDANSGYWCFSAGSRGKPPPAEFINALSMVISTVVSADDTELHYLAGSLPRVPYSAVPSVRAEHRWQHHPFSTVLSGVMLYLPYAA